MVAAVLATAFGIWLLGSLIDRIRIWVFDLLRVRSICVCFENKTTEILSALKKFIKV